MSKFQTRTETAREGHSHKRHVDASAFTLNICLGTTFTGGNLCFGDEQEYTSISHQPGFAILHRGHAPHFAESLKTGERWNLVIWFKDYSNFPFEDLLPELRTYMVSQWIDFGIQLALSRTSKFYNRICLTQNIWKLKSEATWLLFLELGLIYGTFDDWANSDWRLAYKTLLKEATRPRYLEEKRTQISDEEFPAKIETPWYKRIFE